MQHDTVACSVGAEFHFARRTHSLSPDFGCVVIITSRVLLTPEHGATLTRPTKCRDPRPVPRTRDFNAVTRAAERVENVTRLVAVVLQRRYETEKKTAIIKQRKRSNVDVTLEETVSLSHTGSYRFVWHRLILTFNLASRVALNYLRRPFSRPPSLTSMSHRTVYYWCRPWVRRLPVDLSFKNDFVNSSYFAFFSEDDCAWFKMLGLASIANGLEGWKKEATLKYEWPLSVD